MSPGDQKKPYGNGLESFSGSPAPRSAFLAAPTELHCLLQMSPEGKKQNVVKHGTSVYQNSVSKHCESFREEHLLCLSESVPAAGAGAELVDTELPVMVGMPFKGFAGRKNTGMRARVGLTENVKASNVGLDIGSAGVNPVLPETPEFEVKMLPRPRVTG